MKKIIILLTILFSSLSFYMSLKKFDVYTAQKFDNHNLYQRDIAKSKEEAHYQGQYISTSIQEGYINPQQFFAVFDNLLDKYEFRAYQSYVTTNNEKYLFIHNGDQKFLEDILLHNGRITDITSGKIYSSESDEYDKKILNPLHSGDSYYIYDFLDDSNIHRPIASTYYIYTLAGDYPNNIDDFKNELINRYPNLNFMITNFNGGSYTQSSLDVLDYMMIFIMIAVLILSMNMYTIKKAKKIQILKIEGKNSMKIYFEILIPIIIRVLCTQILTFIGLHLIVLKTSLFNALEFYRNLMISQIVFYLIFLFFSLLVYFTVSSIQINTGVKGKTGLSKQKKYLYLFKFIILILCGYLISTSYNGMKQAILFKMNEGKYAQLAEHYHYMGGIESWAVSYRYTKEEEEKLNKIKNYLLENHNLFWFQTVDHDLRIYEVSDNYLNLAEIELLSEIPMNSTDNGSIIYIAYPSDFTEKQYQQMKQAVYQTYNSSGFFEERYIGYTNKKVFVFDTQNLYSGQVLAKNNIFVIQNGLSLQASSTHFYYDGPLTGQEFISQLYEKEQLTVVNDIRSETNELDQASSRAKHSFAYTLPLLLSSTILLILVDYQFIVLLIEADGKKYSILKSNGFNIAYILKDELLISMSLLIFSTLLLFFYFKIGTEYLAIFMLLTVVLDWLMLIGSISLKLKNYTERLR